MPFDEKSGAPVDEEAVSPEPVQPTSQGPPVPEAPPGNKPRPYMYIAAGIVVVVVIIAVVLASVAMSWSSNHVFTPTAGDSTTSPIQTPKTTIAPKTSIPTRTTTVATPQDPVIGVWRHTHEVTGGIDDYRYHFVADGTWGSSLYDSYNKYLEYHRGTWKNQGGNTYWITYVYPSREPESFNYDPARNVLYQGSGYMYDPYQGKLEGI